jgi:hypothetical protein
MCVCWFNKNIKVKTHASRNKFYAYYEADLLFLEVQMNNSVQELDNDHIFQKLVLDVYLLPHPPCIG